MYEYICDAANSGVEQFDVRKYTAAGTAGFDHSNEQGVSRVGRTGGLVQNWILYRLTDVMLMKAEALVQLYELSGRNADDTRNEEAFEICKFVNDRAMIDASAPLGGTQGYEGLKDRMEEVVLEERARELCFEGKRWFDLMRYNYRHTTDQADLTKKLTEKYVMNSDRFFDLALRKYAVPAAMKAKMRDERYLYMPIN